MARSKTSQRWLKEHFNDIYVQKAQQEGYRSRAVYKLMEIQEKDRLIRPGMVVVELGAAPGGWSQYVAQCLNGRGRMIVGTWSSWRWISRRAASHRVEIS